MTEITQDQERELLDRMEGIIERGRQTFVEVGQALAEIRERRLYKLTHQSFEVYCEERWGFSRIHAQRYMQAAEVVTGLLQAVPMGTAPDNERQARELASVEPERRAEVWQKAVESAPVDERTGKPKVTAAAIRDAAEEEESPDQTADTRLDRAREAMRRFDEIRRLARCLKNEAKVLREEGQIPHLSNGFELQVQSIVDVLKESQPFCSCPACAGKGCDKCRGRGWLVKIEHGQLSRRDQAKAVEL